MIGEAQGSATAARVGAVLVVAVIGCLALPGAAGAATGDLTFAQCFDDDDTGTEAACTNQNALDGAGGVAVSPDGRSVYVASLFEDALVRYDRNPASGALTFADCFNDEDTGTEDPPCVNVPGLNSVNTVEVSPDGANLYASSSADSAVVNFARDQSTGALTFSQCLEEADLNFEAASCGNVDGLGGAAALTVSADGRSVYAGSVNDDAVVNFNRNAITGALSFSECFDEADTDQEATCANRDGLDSVTSLDSTTDGKSVYALSNSDNAIVNFDRNPSTGALTYAQCLDDNDTGPEATCTGIDGLGSAGNLAVSDDGRSLYAAALGDDSIVNLNRDPATGALTFSQCFDDNDGADTEAACAEVDGLNGAIAVATSADGSSVYAASQSDHAIVDFDRNPATGGLSFSQCFKDNDTGTEAACTDVDGLQTGEDVKVSPDGRSVIAAGLSDDAVVNFNRDPGSGPLAFAECFDEADTNPEAACTNVDGLDAASAVAVSADGRSLYATSFGDDAIVNFDRDPATGALSFAQCFEDDESSTEAACSDVDALNSASDVAVSPDGLSVYVTSGFDDAVVTFTRNPDTGALTFSGCIDDNDGNAPEAACPGVDGLFSAQSVAVSPDGASVYVGSSADDAVVNFNRNAGTGALTFSQCFDEADTNPEAACTNVDGLDSVAEVSASPDGRSLYAIANTDDSVVNFNRNPSTGALTSAGCLSDNEVGAETACTRIDGLGGTNLSLAASGDGRSLYAIAAGDDAIVNFNRNQATGALAFGECFDDDESGTEAPCPGVDGLGGVTAVTASPDGSAVYTGSAGDSAVVGFSRNPLSGALTFAECLDDNDAGGEAACPGVDGLDFVSSIELSPDGRSVYTSGLTDDAVVEFTRLAPPPVVPPPGGGGGGGGGGAAGDTDPPETTIDKGPKKKSPKRKAKFSFSADEPGSSFECKLDKGDFEPCSSPFKKKVKPSKHRFEVRAKDGAGNVDPTPATLKFKVLG